MARILSINPGSTSTKIAVFDDETSLVTQTLEHSAEQIGRYKRIADQYEFRRDEVLKFLAEKGIPLSSLSAVAARGGLLGPVLGGTYRVNPRMLDYLRNRVEREHASNLAALIGFEIASSAGIPCFITDPVSVDEFDDIARISGLPEIRRESFGHALNMKAAARLAAKDLGKKYEELNLVVVHLGGGISVSPHRKGRMIDVNQALDGTGPFSPERAGGLPTGDLVRMAYSGKYTFDQLYKRLVGGGGLVAHLGTNNAREVENRIEAGDAHARLVYEAMAYQVAKEVGVMSTVLRGEIDAIVITGGLAKSKMLVDWIVERVRWIAPVMLYPGEDELRSLALGALRVVRGEEAAREY